MRRGEIWTAVGPDYMRKPRPALILQADQFDQTSSVTVCPITGDLQDLPLLRLPVSPSALNGLLEPSHVMADKVTTTERRKLGRRLGALEDELQAQVDRLVTVFLGFAD